MPDMWMDVDTALSEVPVNLVPLTDDGDFKSREESVAYNAAGLELIWHFTTTAGATTATVVTPTTGGDYDWAHQDGGLYTIGIPASGGASINNDTEGFGWFTGVATGILPWRGPVIGFRAAALNNALIDGGDVLDVNVTEIADDAITADAFDDTVATDADIAAVLLDKLLADHEIAGSVGKALSDILTDTGTTLDGKIDTVDTVVDAIKAKTDNLPSDPADQSAVEAAIAAIPAAPTTGEIKTALEAAGSHLALILEDTGTSIPDSIEKLAAMVEIIKVIKAHKSIENEAGTLITYRNEGDTADAGTQSWNEATKTRGEYTPS